jgi:hypothetical protein
VLLKAADLELLHHNKVVASVLLHQRLTEHHQDKVHHCVARWVTTSLPARAIALMVIPSLSMRCPSRMINTDKGATDSSHNKVASVSRRLSKVASVNLRRNKEEDSVSRLLNTDSRRVLVDSVSRLHNKVASVAIPVSVSRLRNNLVTDNRSLIQIKDTDSRNKVVVSSSVNRLRSNNKVVLAANTRLRLR